MTDKQIPPKRSRDANCNAEIGNDRINAVIGELTLFSTQFTVMKKNDVSIARIAEMEAELALKRK